jgi:hypothetical protein
MTFGNVNIASLMSKVWILTVRQTQFVRSLNGGEHLLDYVGIVIYFEKVEGTT